MEPTPIGEILASTEIGEAARRHFGNLHRERTQSLLHRHEQAAFSRMMSRVAGYHGTHVLPLPIATEEVQDG